MEVNLEVRMKNPWFWVGVAAIAGSAMGISFDTLTSWQLLYEAFINLLSNPFQLGCVVLAILAVFVDPTTSGFGDSARALGYHKPFKE